MVQFFIVVETRKISCPKKELSLMCFALSVSLVLSASAAMMDGEGQNY